MAQGHLFGRQDLLQLFQRIIIELAHIFQILFLLEFQQLGLQFLHDFGVALGVSLGFFLDGGSEFVGFLLSFGEMVGIYTRHFLDAFLLRRHQATMTCDDIVFPVDDDRIDEAELTQRGTELLDLLRRVGASFVYLRDELVSAGKLKVNRGYHVYLTSCC